jgi:hypothetical protein
MLPRQQRLPLLGIRAGSQLFGYFIETVDRLIIHLKGLLKGGSLFPRNSTERVIVIVVIVIVIIDISQIQIIRVVIQDCARFRILLDHATTR